MKKSLNDHWAGTHLRGNKREVGLHLFFYAKDCHDEIKITKDLVKIVDKYLKERDENLPSATSSNTTMDNRRSKRGGNNTGFISNLINCFTN
jgi:hypothetical protein